MKKEQALFDLIHSMTKGEKRHFKTYTQAVEGKSKAYLKLFDAIDRQKEYSEEALKKKFKNESFIGHFPVVKNYLRNLILKLMRLYREDKDPKQRMKAYLSNCKILRSKGLYSQAIKEMEKGLKLARKLDMALYIAQFLNFKIDIISKSQYMMASFEEVNDLIDQKEKSSEDFLVFAKYGCISQKVENIIIRYGYRSEETRKRIQEIYDLVPIKEVAETHSPRMRYSVHQVRAVINYCYNDYKQYHIEIGAILDALEANPLLLEVELNSYISTLNNYCLSCCYVSSLEFHLEQCKKYEKVILKYKNEKYIKSEIARRLCDARFGYIMQYYFSNKMYPEARDLVFEKVSEFLNVREAISPFYQLNYYYVISNVLFFSGELHKAQEWLLMLQQHPDLKKRYDIHSASELMHLLLHFELNNFMYLESQLKNIRSFFSRKNRFYNFEQKTLEMCRELIRVQNGDLNKTYKKHLKIFKALKKEESSVNAFEWLDIAYWLEQKLKP